MGGAHGVYGNLPSAEDARLHLLICDDGAYPVLADALPMALAGNVTVFDAASRCVALLSATPGWHAERATAMSRSELATVTERPLPPELRDRPIRRTPEDDPQGVALADAVAIVTADASAPGLTDHLVSLPPATRLRAAVDGGHRVCATSGREVFENHAHLFFVNTAPAWRGRGIGSAMTSAAAVAARSEGAQDAFLNASAAGRGLYERLGFDVVARTTRFSRTA